MYTYMYRELYWLVWWDKNGSTVTLSQCKQTSPPPLFVLPVPTAAALTAPTAFGHDTFLGVRTRPTVAGDRSARTYRDYTGTFRTSCKPYPLKGDMRGKGVNIVETCSRPQPFVSPIAVPAYQASASHPAPAPTLGTRSIRTEASQAKATHLPSGIDPHPASAPTHTLLSHTHSSTFGIRYIEDA